MVLPIHCSGPACFHQIGSTKNQTMNGSQISGIQRCLSSLGYSFHQMARNVGILLPNSEGSFITFFRKRSPALLHTTQWQNRRRLSPGRYRDGRLRASGKPPSPVTSKSILSCSSWETPFCCRWRTDLSLFALRLSVSELRPLRSDRF